MAEDHGNLEPPSRTSIDDPGAHDLDSSESSDDHFSDARSGLEHSALNSPIDIPVTRIEKVDNEPSYGEVPGTDAYKARGEDAEPDQIAVIPDSKDEDLDPIARSSTPGGRPIPTTIVEKIDTDMPSYGEVPGTAAHELRSADAVPDMVVRASGFSSRSSSVSRARAGSTPGDLPIPITRVEKIDSKPSHGEVPGTDAYELRKQDAEPDVVEEIGDRPGSPTSPATRSSFLSHSRRKSSGAGRRKASVDNTFNDHDYNEAEDGSDEAGFGDDFDDFEDGAEDADFDDFDDGFQEAEIAPAPPQSIPIVPSFPVLDFDSLDTPEEIQSATEPYLDALFPPDTIDNSVLPPLSNDKNPIFLTQRSASLWSQLVAPPPLQPPNWIRSRIRRLFLVSLGVPVDLDEILPASKQKKLILPSIHLSHSSTSPRTSTDSPSISRLKTSDSNNSTTSIDSQGKQVPSKRRRGPPPAPDLDLVSARQLCTVTDEALNGMTIEELKDHVQKLKAMEVMAKEVLEYWTKTTDEKLGDREAFEGVIENLVKHARKTRK